MTSAVAGSSGVEVVRAEERHDGVLAEFFRGVWDAGATAGTVARGRAETARLNPVSPGEEAPRFLVLADGRVIGYVSTIPVIAWCGGAPTPAHWIKGLMVVPEHRNGPVGFSVLKEAVRHLGDAWLLAMVVEAAPRKLFGPLGFTDLGGVPEYLRVLDPAPLIQRLGAEGSDAPLPGSALGALRLVRKLGLHRPLGWLGGAVGDAVRLAVGSPGSGTAAHEVPALDPGTVDELWGRAKRAEVWAPAVRDGAALTRRYGGDPAYRLGSVARDAGPAGLAVVRRPAPAGAPRLGGARVATISELLYARDRPGHGLATLALAERLAGDSGAEAVLCAASEPEVGRLLLRRSFLPIPRRTHFLVRPPEGTGEFPTKISSWWVTRGDSRADEAF